MPFQIIRNDITKVRADAIVNTANPDPVWGSGTDSAIYRAAGERKLLEARRRIGPIAVGEAAVTPAFRLHARYIIHTVGPVWRGGGCGELDLLASCYRKSLALARELGCRSVAFPLLSTGVYGFPKDRALDVALAEISAFLRGKDKCGQDALQDGRAVGRNDRAARGDGRVAGRNDREIAGKADTGHQSAPPDEEEMRVTLVVFDRRSFELSADLHLGIESYIDEHSVEAQRAREYGAGNREAGSGSPAGRRRNLLFGIPRESAAAPPAHADGCAPDADLPAESFGRKASEAFPHADANVPLGYESGEEAPDAFSGASAPGSVIADQTAPYLAQRRRRSLRDVMNHVGETFQECLMRLIDERGLTDAEVYKRANIDRKLFSKIRCNPGYTPRRRTAIALAIALELNRDEMTDLLRRAGIALSPGSRFDLIIGYCVENGIYDIFRINAILFEYGQPLLGA